MSTKFTFTGQPKFEMDENTAAEILADPFPNRALDEWMSRQHPLLETDCMAGYDSQRTKSWELQQVEAAFGKHLAEKKVAERKMLSPAIEQPAG